MNLSKKIVLGICLIAGLNASAQEAESKIKKPKKFAKIDTNNDGKLSLEEYSTYRTALRDKKGKEPKKGDFSKRFKQIDLNQDGFLSKEEFKNRKATKSPKKDKKTKG